MKEGRKRKGGEEDEDEKKDEVGRGKEWKKTRKKITQGKRNEDDDD